MAWSDTDLQTLTGSAAFLQCQNNFTALKTEALTIAAVKTFSSSPIVPTPTTDMQASTKKYVDDAILATKLVLFPVGSIYSNKAVATNPATLLGFGTWVAIGGKVLVGLDGTTEFATLNQTGGAKTHTLTTAEMPAHTHIIPTVNNFGTSNTGVPHGDNDVRTETPATNSTGGGGAHNNLQPYLVIYMWERTA